MIKEDQCTVFNLRQFFREVSLKLTKLIILRIQIVSDCFI